MKIDLKKIHEEELKELCRLRLLYRDHKDAHEDCYNRIMLLFEANPNGDEETDKVHIEAREHRDEMRKLEAQTLKSDIRIQFIEELIRLKEKRAPRTAKKKGGEQHAE